MTSAAAQEEERLRRSRRGSALRASFALPLLVMLAACAVSTDGDDDLPEALEELGAAEDPLTAIVPERDDPVTRNAWQTLGVGVSHKSFASGSNVLLVYGGYTAQDLYVQRWANELYRARGAALGIGELYAVRGPNQSGYANREIQNSKIAAHLGAGGTNGRAAKAATIVVVAHSSGTYVADELIAMLRTGSGGVPNDAIQKVALFNLDGGGVADPTTLRMMSNAYFVHACDPALDRCSRNSSSMKARGAQYASKGGALLVNAAQSGCSRSDGGLWCLHDALITNRPHNPNMYDLRNDYTDFTAGREVVTSYLDVLDTQ